MNQCKNLIGPFVADYWIDNAWVDLSRLDPNLVELRNCLNVFFLIHKEDELIWSNDTSGDYFFTLADADAFANYEEPCWAKAWMKGMTPKVNIFFWILLQNKVLTLDNLQKRGMIIINHCALYKNDRKSVDHIILHCQFAKKIWDSIFKIINIEWVFPPTIQLFFSSSKAPTKNTLIGKYGTSFFLMLDGVSGRSEMIEFLEMLIPVLPKFSIKLKL